MSFSIVAQSAQQTVNAASDTITLPSMLDGDHFYLAVAARKAGGGYTWADPPTDMTYVTSLGDLFLFAQVVSGTPPTTKTVTFADSDVYAEMRCVVTRGGKPLGGRSYQTSTSFDGTGTSQTIPAQTTSLNDTVLLTFAQARTATITAPGSHTSLFSTTQAGPPALSLAASYYVAPTPALVTGQTLTLSGSELISGVTLRILTDGITDPFAAYWSSIDDLFMHDIDCYIFDRDGNYVYMMGLEDTSSSPQTLRLYKFDRTSHAQLATHVYSGDDLANVLEGADQDTTHIYITPHQQTLMKIAKSDLSLTAESAPVPGITAGQSLFSPHIGHGWSAGKVWAQTRHGTDGYYGAGHTSRLVSWDTTTMNVIDNIELPFSMDWDGADTLIAVDDLIVTTSGDVWIIALIENYAVSPPRPSTRQSVMFKVGSDLTPTTPVMLDEQRGTAQFGMRLFYDPSEETIIAAGEGGLFGNVFMKWDIGTETLLDTVYHFGRNIGVAFNSHGRDMSTLGGVRYLFFGLTAPYSDEWAGSGGLLQLRADDLSVVRVLEIPEGYMIPAGAALSPEGTALWMGAWQGVDRKGSLLILDAVGSPLSGTPAPPWIRPLFGRGHGWQRRFDGQ